MAKLKTAVVIGKLMDKMAAYESLRSKLAQLEAETLACVNELVATGHYHTKRYPAISKLLETKDAK